jgi:hypothetical protein
MGFHKYKAGIAWTDSGLIYKIRTIPIRLGGAHLTIIETPVFPWPESGKRAAEKS